MKMYWRFVWQENIYWASCEPCTASVFATQVRNAQVNWKIGTRRAIIKAVREGLNFIPVSHIDEIIPLSLCADKKARRSAAPVGALRN